MITFLSITNILPSENFLIALERARCSSKKLIDLLRRAGAKEVHFRISSPVVQYPCYFGIDTPYRKELIGSGNTVDEIKEIIGADSLGYISMEGLVNSMNPDKGFCLGCFNGVYPVSAPIEASKEHLER